MGVIMNCLDKELDARVGGEHFYFKPNQIKFFYNPHISGLMVRLYGERGLVELPESMQEKEHQVSVEGKKLIADARSEGIARYCETLRAQIYNLQVSLKRDLDHTNYKVDPRIYASKGDEEAMRELLKYQGSNEDKVQNKLDTIKELEKKLQG